MSEARDKILEAAAALEKTLPQIDQAKAERARVLIDRIRQARDERMSRPFQPGICVTIDNPFQRMQHLRDMKDLLELYRDVILPSALHGQVAKLRALAHMVENG